MFGGDEGIRTLDLCVANAPLSRLSYIPTQKIILDHLQKISIVIFTWAVTAEAPQWNKRAKAFHRASRGHNSNLPFPLFTKEGERKTTGEGRAFLAQSSALYALRFSPAPCPVSRAPCTLYHYLILTFRVLGFSARRIAMV